MTSPPDCNPWPRGSREPARPGGPEGVPGYRMLWAFVWAGNVLRLGLCLWRPPTAFLFSDPNRHWLNARRFAAPDLMGASDPILYQLYLFLLQQVTASQPWLLAAACGLLSIAMAWLFYRAALASGLPPMAALVVYVVMAWLPSSMVIFHYFMPETLLLCAVGAGLWMSGEHLRRRDTASFLAAVAAWTLACLTKASAAPLAAICLLYLAAATRPRPAVLAAAAMLILALGLPNALRTRRYLGFAAPLGSPWIPAIQHQSDAKTIRIHWKKGCWEFSSPSCYVAPLAPLSPWLIERASEGAIVEIYIDPKHGQQDWQSANQALAKPGWRHAAARRWENALLFIFAPSWPDSDTTHMEGRLNDWQRWLWGPLLFCVLWGNAARWRRGCRELLPIATTGFTLFLLLQDTVTMEGRYRKPVEPLLIMNFIRLQCAEPGREKFS